MNQEPRNKSGKPVATPLCGVSNPTAVGDRGLFLSCSGFATDFETRSFPNSLAAYPRDFAFYVADPISSIHRFSQIIK
jgi:hypothetical protein